jgi:hypothetical protein
MPRLEEVITDVKVTALLVIDDDDADDHVVLAGVGGNVEVRRRRNGDAEANRSYVLKIFNGASVHGFVRGRNEEVLVYGAKQFAVVCVNAAAVTVVNEATTCEDWIVAARWVDDDDSAVLLLTAHNRVLKFVTSRRNELTAPVLQWTCEEKCILYCGLLVADVGKNSSAAIAGTVFQEIVIWTVSSDEGGDARVHHRLQGHEGVIFSLAFRGDRLCSTSDDRTARVYALLSLWSFSLIRIDLSGGGSTSPKTPPPWTGRVPPSCWSAC